MIETMESRPAETAGEPKGYQKDLVIERRQEPVRLKRGTVWVKELTLADMAQITERSTRPSVDPRGGHDGTALIAYQIMFACYENDRTDAPRVFGDRDMPHILELSLSEMELLMAAINRTCGKDAAQEELLRDFSPAAGARNTSD